MDLKDIRRLFGLVDKGSREYREGKGRNVPRIAWREKTARPSSTGQLKTEGIKLPFTKAQEVANKKIIDTDTKRYVEGATRNPRFGRRPPMKLPPGVLGGGPVGSGLITALTPSPTNLDSLTDDFGKTITVPDDIKARARNVDWANENFNKMNFNKAFATAAKLSMPKFVWQGNSYEVRTDDNRINMIETIAKQMARYEKQNKMPIIFGGAYVGNRPMTMTEGVKKENTRQPPKKRASKTGTSALVLSEEGRLTPNKAPIAPSMMKKGGFITKRGPLNRGKKKGK